MNIEANQTVSGLNSLFELLERHPGRVFWCVGLAFVTLYMSSHALFPREGGRIINGDAVQYYAYLRSLVVDGDLDFQNDYRLLYEPESDGSDDWATIPSTGRAENLMAVGPALLWAPLFLVVGVFMRALGGPLDGLAAPFQLSAGVAGILYGTAGLHLCYDLCRRVIDARSAFWATLTAWLATSAVYYTWSPRRTRMPCRSSP